MTSNTRPAKRDAANNYHECQIAFSCDSVMPYLIIILDCPGMMITSINDIKIINMVNGRLKRS